jgi:two-component system phosphate regulon sensor histidine kinase PhoR
MLRNRLTGHLTIRFFLVSLAAIGVFAWLASGAIDRPLEWSIVWQILAALALAAVISGAFGWWLARRTSRQFQAIARGAEQLSRGAAAAKLDLPDIEELAVLAAVLNRIATQIDQRTQRIGRQDYQQEAVLASMIEGVLAVDSDERIITLNSAAAELIGNHQSNLQGRNLHEVIRNADLRRFVQRALESPDPIEDDVVLHGQRERIFRVRGTALRDGSAPSGSGVGAVVVLADVTRYRQLENLRRDFVANVSHELKTPIASIKGFVETLLDGALANPEDADRFLKIIASHAERLNNIIEDLLSLSKIEQSEEAANLPLSRALLRPVLEAAISSCQPQADARQVALVLDCDPSITVQLNPPLFEQAVINLIDNAIKYSGTHSQVIIEASVAEVESAANEPPVPDQAEIVLSVRDRGCGIAAEHLPRLFERFYRARSRKLGGTGLGLAIVKHIVQAHHGRITVESTLGEGSVFSIHLPAKSEIESPKPEANPKSEARMPEAHYAM